MPELVDMLYVGMALICLSIGLTLLDDVLNGKKNSEENTKRLEEEVKKEVKDGKIRAGSRRQISRIYHWF